MFAAYFFIRLRLALALGSEKLRNFILDKHLIGRSISWRKQKQAIDGPHPYSVSSCTESEHWGTVTLHSLFNLASLFFTKASFCALPAHYKAQYNTHATCFQILFRLPPALSYLLDSFPSALCGSFKGLNPYWCKAIVLTCAQIVWAFRF